MSQGDANPASDSKSGAGGEDVPVGRHVVFSHGKESGPWGRKISSLAEVARSEGYEAHSVDYRGLDEPHLRVARLVEFCKDLAGDLVLVGSSLGGYVAVSSASLLHARGIFLMAPALYVPGLPDLRDGVLDCPATLVHGWRDDVVPFEDSVRFAKGHRAALHLLESDHNLHNQIRVIQYLFEYFLIALDLPALAFE
ncbi:MAG TPA: alpha/beta hydrolase [Steroidobacteraceae bacterium]|nr:alpha/beta hydrolase [Steroidobacteraceae bacterium]